MSLSYFTQFISLFMYFYSIRSNYSIHQWKHHIKPSVPCIMSSVALFTTIFWKIPKFEKFSNVLLNRCILAWYQYFCNSLGQDNIKKTLVIKNNDLGKMTFTIGLTPVNIMDSPKPDHKFVPKIPKLIQKKNHKKWGNVGRRKFFSWSWLVWSSLQNMFCLADDDFSCGI